MLTAKRGGGGHKFLSEEGGDTDEAASFSSLEQTRVCQNHNTMS